MRKVCKVVQFVLFEARLLDLFRLVQRISNNLNNTLSNKCYNCIKVDRGRLNCMGGDYRGRGTRPPSQKKFCLGTQTPTTATFSKQKL